MTSHHRLVLGLAVLLKNNRGSRDRGKGRGGGTRGGHSGTCISCPKTEVEGSDVKGGHRRRNCRSAWYRHHLGQGGWAIVSTWAIHYYKQYIIIRIIIVTDFLLYRVEYVKLKTIIIITITIIINYGLSLSVMLMIYINPDWLIAWARSTICKFD